MRRVDIEFASEGTTCRGWLFLPEGDGPFPAVALAGGWCYVRELVMPCYAQAFAEADIAASARHRGARRGPRHLGGRRPGDVMAG
jgi:hypothetical protein